MFDGQNLFDQLVINNLRMHDGIRKTETGQGDDYSTGCLLDYNYFKNYYKVIAIDLSKQQALDADPKAIQQISFTGNLDQAADATMFSIIEKFLDFSQGTLKVFSLCFLP